MSSLHLAPMGQISHHNIGLCVCLRANTQYNTVKTHLAKKNMFYLFEGSLIIAPCRKHAIFFIWNFDLFYLKLFLHRPFSMGILHYQSCSNQYGNSCNCLRFQMVLEDCLDMNCLLEDRKGCVLEDFLVISSHFS